MIPTKDEITTAAEAWAEQFKTGEWFERLRKEAFEAGAAWALSQNSANAMLCEPKAEPLPSSNCYDPICSSCKQPMEEDEGRWGICNDCIKES